MSTLQDITSPMSASEKRATASLASVYALRMLGLFMILPVLPLFSEQLEGSTPALIGLAMGIYGLPQVLLQIPFGLLSDKFGRKKIILIGLSLFFTGSVIASLSTTIYGVLVGRAFQGAGAVSAVVMALVADLTQEVHRTKAMAVIGASIGLSFGVGIVLGPIISHFGGVPMVFAATAVLTALAMLSVLYVVPNPQKSKLHRDAEFVPAQAMSALKNPDLLRLDYGIFVQHLLLMAIFVVIPSLMRQAGLTAGHEWMVYLPIFATSMAAMIPFIILAEKKRKMKAVFLGAVGILALSTIGLSFLHDDGKSAKYLNSPETPIFNKSSVLFGIDKAKDSIRKNNFSILVEGQMDLVLSHQAGFKNTVASSGTAMTDSVLSKENIINNLGLVCRLSKNIVLSYDADKAGVNASNRFAKIALALGMDVKVADMKDDLDPADIISKNGVDQITALTTKTTAELITMATA